MALFKKTPKKQKKGRRPGKGMPPFDNQQVNPNQVGTQGYPQTGDPNDPNNMQDLSQYLTKQEPVTVGKLGRKGIRSKVEQEQSELKELKRTEKLGAINYFVERILNKTTQGSLDIQGAPFEISYSKIMSEKSKKRVIRIIEFPTWVNAGHLESIRVKAKDAFPRTDMDKIEVYIIEHNIGHHINFIHNRKLNSTQRNFRRQLIDLSSEKIKKEASERLGATNIASNRDDVSLMMVREERLERKVFSFNSIKAHQSTGETLKSYIFIEVVADTIELTDKLADVVIGLLNTNNYRYEEVTELEEYQSTFGLASLNYQKEMKKIDMYPVTVTSDVSSATPTYTEGIIRSEAGDVYIGNSIDTGYPVFISFSESAAATNMLVVAGSGSGKTVNIKTLALGCLNHRNNSYNLIVTDYKGGEWDSMTDIIENTETISMGISNPKFINTLIIPDKVTYGFMKDDTCYNLSAGYTQKLLSTLVSTSNEYSLHQIQMVCADIVKRIYLFNGVDVKRPSTYKLSKDFRFIEEVWSATDYICSQSTDMVARHGQGLLGYVKTSLEPYFTIRGSKRYMFENSLDMDSLMDKKMIVFDYGAQTAGGQASLEENEVNVRVLQKNFFSTLYSAKNKLKREYTIDIEEEVQRQITNPILAKELNDKITGGRSSNRSTILLTNTVTGMLDSKDLNITAIKENITTVMLGKVKRDVAKDTLEYFGLTQAWERVQSILTSNEGYDHVFLSAFNTGKVFDMCLTKVTLPKEIIDSKIFESRTVEEYDKKEL